MINRLHAAGQERSPADQQFVEDDAQTIDVGSRPDLRGIAVELFGRHVSGRADDRAGPRQPRVAVTEAAGQAKVHDDGLAATLEQHVGRFEVAVHDTAVVHGLQSQLQTNVAVASVFFYQVENWIGHVVRPRADGQADDLRMIEGFVIKSA